MLGQCVKIYGQPRFASPSINRVSAKLSRPQQRMHRKRVVANSPAVPQVEEEVHTSLSREHMDSFLESFQRADQNSDGVLDREELKTLLESFEGGKVQGPKHWLTDEDVDEVLRQYDADSSGDISFEEFQSLATDRVILEGQLQQYQEAFTAADVSGDGRLQITELHQLFDDLGLGVSMPDTVKLFTQFDKDENGTIEFVEFLQMMRYKVLEFDDIVRYLKMKPSTEQPEASTQEDDVVIDETERLKVTQFESEQELDKLLEAWGKEHFVVVNASMSWCRHCKSMVRPMERMAEAYPQVKFIKFFGNGNANLKELFKNRLRSRGVPAFYLYNMNGELIASQSGTKKYKLETLIRQAVDDDKMPAEPLYEVPADQVASTLSESQAQVTQ